VSLRTATTGMCPPACLAAAWPTGTSLGAHGAPASRHASARSFKQAPTDASGGSAPGGSLSASSAAPAAPAFGVVCCFLLLAALSRWSQLLRPRATWRFLVVLALPERPG
jgi:hypothetical protein